MKPACLNLARQEKAKGFHREDTDETKTTAETQRTLRFLSHCDVSLFLAYSDWRVGTGLRFWRVCAH
jgi:hypothetical protein